MSYHDGASSHFSLWQSQSGLGRGGARSTYSANSRNARSPLSITEVGAVTPAQAYANAVKTGETHDRALYYTIERKQPGGEGRPNPQLLPSQLGNPGSPEHGLSFAQRLYAGALSHKSSTLPSSDIPVLPPIKYVSSSPGALPRKTSFSASSFATSSEISQSFNPADLYHSSVVTHEFPSRPTNSGVSTMRHLPLPVLQIPHPPPVTSPPHSANTHAFYSPSENSIFQLEVQSPRPALHRHQIVLPEARPYSIPVVSIHGTSDLQGSVETYQGFCPPAVASGEMPPPPPSEQQLVIPASSSPPAFEEHEHEREAGPEVAPVDTQPLAAAPHEDGLPDSSLQPPHGVNHEDVPLYSLVDEQLPPPAFDDLQATNAAQASAERSPVVRPESLIQEEALAPSFTSSPPSQSPPPFSHGSAAYAPEKAPAYVHLDKPSYSVGTRENILQDARIPLPSITTGHPSGPSSSDPPRSVPTDFQWRNQTPSVSPPISPLHPNHHYHPFMPPSHSPDRQSTRTPCDPLSIPRNTTISPPLVNYHTKPAFKQSGQPFPPPHALQRTPGGLNMAKQGRRDSQPSVSVTEDSNAVDALTRSMSTMMRGTSPNTHTLAFESLPSGTQNCLGRPLGNQQNVPGSHPSGTVRTIGSLSQEISRSEAERSIQETYWRPSQGETGGQAGYRIQGLDSANPPAVTNILSSQHSPRIISSLGPIPPTYSHEELQTVSVSTAGDEVIISQSSETVALSPSGSSHSDRHHIVPTRSFPDPFPLSHRCIDQDVHGCVPPSGFVHPQQQRIHSPENLDPMKRGGHGFPPPPPPPPTIPPEPWSVSQTLQTSLYSQDCAKDQHVPGIKAPALNSNDLARKFAHDALLASAGAPAYAFHGTRRC